MLTSYNRASHPNLSIVKTKMNNSIIYALDFDGVICDSAVETAITAGKRQAAFGDMPKATPQAMIDQFR